MTDDDLSKSDDFDVSPPIRGRTWADVFVGTTYLFAGLIFLIISGVLVWFIFGRLPNWFFISILGSCLFIPFLFERAKDGADLYLVSEDPFNLTEYRIGRFTGVEIEGRGVLLQSKSGVHRTLLTYFDPQSLYGKGALFAEADQIDQMRDITTLQRITNTLENTLKETRISKQEVGIEVEKRSIEIVDWALKTIYGAIVPTEISEAFGIETKEAPDIETFSDGVEFKDD
jgi:hypothetical protein